MRIKLNGILTPAISAVGIGLLVGSWSVMRESSYFDSALFAPAAPMIMGLSALVFAIVLRKKELKTRSFFIVAATLVSFQLLAMLLAPMFSGSEKIALGVVVTVAEGVSSCLFMFLFLTGLIRCSFREIAVAIAAGYLLVHVYDGLFLGAPEAVRLLQRPAGLLAILTLAGVLSHQMRKRTSSEVEAPEGQAKSASYMAGLPSGEQPETVADCVLLACFVSVVLLIQGVYSQVTGLGSAGNTPAFNMFAEVFAAGARVAVLAYCLLCKRELSSLHIAVGASLFCLAGIPAVELLWGTDAYLVGSTIINSARYILLPVVSIFGVQMARRFPENTRLMIAATYSCYVSRFAALGLVADFAANPSVGLPLVTLCSLWVVACAMPAYLLIRRHLHSRGTRNANRADAASAEVAQLGAPIETGAAHVRPHASQALSEITDPALLGEIQFYQRLESLCDEAQLTEREKEILREVLHGYSIDSIASRLNLSASTVKTYLSRSYTRFGVTSRQAVLRLLDTEIEHEKPSKP